MNPVLALRIAAVLSLALVLGGCVSKSIKSTSVPSVNGATVEVQEALLLDVGIAVFDPGIENYDEEDDERIYPEVRRAEARYMPNILSEAMQNSGAWGAVRVVPDNKQITDLMVEGEILHSDGEELQLQIKATDSRGYVWLDCSVRKSGARKIAGLCVPSPSYCSRAVFPPMLSTAIWARTARSTTWCCACPPRTIPCWNGFAPSVNGTRCSSTPCRTTT